MSGALSVLVAIGGIPGVIQNISNGADAIGVTLSLNNDGTYTMTGSAGGNWVSPATSVVAAQWEVKIDVTAGAFTAGSAATGAWLAMSAGRGWIEDSGSVTFDISWRESATGLVRKVQTGVTMEIV